MLSVSPLAFAANDHSSNAGSSHTGHSDALMVLLGHKIALQKLQNEFPLSNVNYSLSVLDLKKFEVIGLSKALILPSWNEGAPLVILEAMSLGTPIIASNVGFIREMVGDDYPFLFEAQNITMLKSTILKFEALTEQELQDIGSGLKRRFKHEYTRERRVSDYLEVFS
jgi:glycosyltransferase involved in cell wall biosynthesis